MDCALWELAALGARRRSVLACHGEGGRVSLDFVLKNHEKLIKQAPIMQKISLNRMDICKQITPSVCLRLYALEASCSSTLFNFENENRNFIRYENRALDRRS